MTTQAFEKLCKIMKPNKKIIIAAAFLLVLGILAAFSLEKDEQLPQPAPVESNVVTIRNFAYVPATLAIQRGASVTWVNRDDTEHNVASSAFSSPLLPEGGSFSYVFQKPGIYDYYCSTHTAMTGTIVVK